MRPKRDTIDISDHPELVQLVEEMRRRDTSLVLRSGDENLALMSPMPGVNGSKAMRPNSNEKSQADIDAFLAAAGGWKDLVDTEQLKRDSYAARERSSRPPLEL